VDVRNRGAAPVRGLVVRVSLGDGERAERSAARLLPAEPGVVRLALPPIPSGGTRSYRVTLLSGRQ